LLPLSAITISLRKLCRAMYERALAMQIGNVRASFRQGIKMVRVISSLIVIRLAGAAGARTLRRQDARAQRFYCFSGHRCPWYAGTPNSYAHQSVMPPPPTFKSFRYDINMGRYANFISHIKLLVDDSGNKDNCRDSNFLHLPGTWQALSIRLWRSLRRAIMKEPIIVIAVDALISACDSDTNTIPRDLLNARLLRRTLRRAT